MLGWQLHLSRRTTEEQDLSGYRGPNPTGPGRAPKSRAGTSEASKRVVVPFENNRHLTQLLGQHDVHLALLDEEARGSPWMVAGLGVDIRPLIPLTVKRGGHVRVGLEDAPFGSRHSNRALVEEAEATERAAKKLSAGWEAEIGIAMDVAFPSWLLLQCLARFGAESAHTRIEVIESVLGGTAEALLLGEAQLAITGMVPQGFAGELLMPIRFLPQLFPRMNSAIQSIGWRSFCCSWRRGWTFSSTTLRSCRPASSASTGSS